MMTISLVWMGAAIVVTALFFLIAEGSKEC